MRTEQNDNKYIQLLENLEKAFRELVIFYNDGNTDPDAEYHLIASNTYPFEASFDDYLEAIRNWIKQTKYELTAQEWTVSWVETEAHEKTITVKAMSAEDAIKKVRNMAPTEAESDEFLHPIEQLQDSFAIHPRSKGWKPQ